MNRKALGLLQFTCDTSFPVGQTVRLKVGAYGFGFKVLRCIKNPGGETFAIRGIVVPEDEVQNVTGPFIGKVKA